MGNKQIQKMILIIGLISLMALNTEVLAESSPFLDAIFCPFRPEPWSCARLQASRMLANLDVVLQNKIEEFKVEADEEVEKNMQARGFSINDNMEEKPSFLMTNLEETLTDVADLVTDSSTGRKKVEKKNEDDKKKEKSQSVQIVHHVQVQDSKNNKKNKEIQIGQIGQIAEHLSSIHGRSLGDERGKKKKKKKAIMKLLLLGAVVKGKIELLLKLLSAHLQIKFLAIAAIGLLINLARFWIDIKKGHQPQKVIYYEHAQHQHHYDDHGDDWSSGGSGYWKRSLSAPGPEQSRSMEASELAYNQQKPPTDFYSNLRSK